MKGPAVATGVQVSDQLPSGTTYISHATAAGNYNTTTGIWNIGTLAVNQEVSLQITVELTQAGQINNIAQVIAANEEDPDSTPNNNVPQEDDQDNDLITVVEPTPQVADLWLNKFSNTNNQAIEVGDEFTYTIKVINDDELQQV
ncbi:MAG: DUF11 domain-containing protein [Chitinophagales bacterium]